MRPPAVEECHRVVTRRSRSFPGVRNGATASLSCDFVSVQVLDTARPARLATHRELHQWAEVHRHVGVAAGEPRYSEPQTALVSQTPRMASAQAARSAACSFAGVSFGEILYQTRSRRPCSSTRKAERSMPRYFRPYMLFSTQTP